MDREAQLEKLTLPRDGEKLTVPTLVVGGTLAAYTATLAALREGDRVCWVTPETPDRLFRVPAAALPEEARSLIARVGSRHRLPGTHFAMSLSQRQWRERWQLVPSPLSGVSSLAPRKDLTSATGQTASEPSRGGIKAYLQSQQLTIIPNAQAVLVLYKAIKGQCHITQVVFRHTQKPHRFSVQAELTLDATPTGELRRLLEETLAADADVPEGALTTPALIVPANARRQARGACFEDSVGIGLPLPVAKEEGPPARLLPFTIPAQALVFNQAQGLLLAGASIVANEGVSTPLQMPALEWAIGEASGHLAAIAHRDHLAPQAILADPYRLKQLQLSLVRYGIPLFWFDDIAQDDPDFEAVQMLAVADVMRTTSLRDLHFRPEVPVTRSVLAAALVRLAAATEALKPSQEMAASTLPNLPTDVPPQHWAKAAIQQAMEQGWMLSLQSRFRPSRVVTHRQLYMTLERFYPQGVEATYQTTAVDDRPVKRRDLARLLYGIYRQRLGIRP